MLKNKIITVKFKDDMLKPETVQVIELGFLTFLNCCGRGTHDTELAEAAVRRISAPGVYSAYVPPGWMDSLADDSVEEIVLASNELNITAARAKKAAGLINDRMARQFGQPAPTSTNSGESSSS